MQKKGLVPLLPVWTENPAHDQLVEFIAVQGRGDQGRGFGFKCSEIGLAQRPFAHQEQGAVFGGEVVVEGGGGGKGDGFRGLRDDVQGEGGGVVAVPVGLEEVARPEGFDHALHGREREVTVPGEVVVADCGDEILRCIPEPQVDTLFRGGEIRHHPGHELCELLIVHRLFLLPQ